MFGLQAGARQRVGAPEFFHSQFTELSGAVHVDGVGAMPPCCKFETDRVSKSRGPDVFIVRWQRIEIYVSGSEDQITVTGPASVVVTGHTHHAGLRGRVSA